MSKRNEHMQADGQKSVTPGTGFTVSRFWKTMIVAGILIIGGGALFFAQPVGKADAAEVIVYKSSSCQCCEKWVTHMRDAGFQVTTRDSDDMDNIKSFYGVTPELRSCHTAVVADYVVEGHVPADDIKRLLRERPVVAGLAVPGMPMGSPGMEGPRHDQYNVLAFDRNGKTTVYAGH